MRLNAPLVGAHFRPPAKALLKVLPADSPLLLLPEPTNPYDANAIAVYLEPSTIPEDAEEELSFDLPGMGFSFADVLAQPRWHVGYVAKEIAAQHIEALNKAIDEARVETGEDFWRAKLGFDGAGKYRVIAEL